MRRRGLSVYYSILLAILQVFTVNGAAFAGVNDFYFKDFTGDYYLSRDTEGISHLRVVESVTAVFPDYNQNKGICRQIPYTNQDGNNITLPSLTRDNLKLTRNGQPEPIYSIELEFDYFEVCTGNDDYVLGEQTYVFEYEFSKVVTEFTNGERNWQELYWDTNGNGAMQRFDAVTARLHFEDPSVFTGESWCYVGVYGDSGQDRCGITKISDGVEFRAENLSSNENLTFDVELKAGSFVVPAPTKNYFYVFITIGTLVIGLAVAGYFLHKFLKNREKANYYNGIFVKPEYQPHSRYTLPEMAEIYIGNKKDAKVAMLLEMVVNHQIELKKLGKRKWSIVVKETEGLGREYMCLLAILNGGTRPEAGDEVEIKRRSANTMLVSLKHSIDKKVLGDLKTAGLAEKGYQIGESSKHGFGNVFMMTIMFVTLFLMMQSFIIGILQDMFSSVMMRGQEFVFFPDYYYAVFVIALITVLVSVLLNNAATRYVNYTHAGLVASRYMEGLKLYIEMAEADRLKFLQSVDGADVSANGIVKLYEKLLPYAAVFGLEESWMDEMKKYCEVSDVTEPDYLANGFVTSEIIRGLHTASSYATSSTVMSSSGGGSSSGFSGGGGGGFSGGGGGGGGFSGR